MQKITAIQYSTTRDRKSGAVSYRGHIVIDDIFLVQFGGNSDECTYSFPAGEKASWNNDAAAQDDAHDKYSKKELVDFIEAQGFENNLFYLEENSDWRVD